MTEMTEDSRVAERWGARLGFALPEGAAGRWCAVTARAPANAGRWWAKLELTDEARGQVVREIFLGPLRRRGAERRTLAHVPSEARRLELLLFCEAVPPDIRLSIRPLSRAGAAASLLLRGRAALHGVLRGQPLGAAGRIRALLGQAPARAGEAPPYAAWLRWFGGAPQTGAGNAWPAQIVIVGQGDAEATRASLPEEDRAGAVRVTSPEDWSLVSAEWAIILAAGNVLTPGAMARFAAAARANPHCLMMTADCDRMAAGARTDPLFKPGPDPLLLPSLLPLQGATAFRWDCGTKHMPADALDAARLLADRSHGAWGHVPHILCSVAGSYRIEKPAASKPEAAPEICAIIPSALRAMHAAQCIGRIVHGTEYASLRCGVVLTSLRDADDRVLARVHALPDLEIWDAPLDSFNFSSAVNAGAARTKAPYLLLLNDDVAPASPEWLSAMVALMADPHVGIVGARLLYGNRMVQHEGVIMGLANLCEHAGRLRADGDAGPHGIGTLTRQVSAVTAACCLVRREVFAALGGMDPAYAVALNDVDFCLRAREAGWKIVYCAEAELFHYESLSLGRHYAGGRAGLEALEVGRLRQAWTGVIADDPFYNRQASLQPGREWLPAFPPRMPECVMCSCDTPEKKA